MKTHKRARAVVAVAAFTATVAALFAPSPDPELDHADIRPEPLVERPGQTDCPMGAMGPEMVSLPEGFCIDTTEVTRGQYQAWLDESPGTAGQPSACADNDSFEPGCQWPPGGDDAELPVVCVDWCDARAFCEAAGKRLCGAIGDGGPYAFDQYADPATSEWFAACTSGGAHEYTYGDTLDRAICRGGDAEDFSTWGLVDVGTLPGCHSPDAPYDAAYDLSGNAAEWDGACEGDGSDAPCRIRGGSFEHQHHGLRCAMGENLRWPRMRQHVAIGFRCCGG